MKKVANIEERSAILYSALQEKLSTARIQYPDDLKYAEFAVRISHSHFTELKALIANFKFTKKEEEIKFFKKIKPQFSSELIFYYKLLQILSRWPTGDIKIQLEYIQSKLDRLKYFFDLNEEFYCYYRFECTHLDEKYFIRGNHDIHLNMDGFFFETDTTFCTNHDFKIAKILANNRLQVYLLQKIELFSMGNTNELTNHYANFKLIWTESKVSLIELIYGLHSQKAFNMGNTEVKDIAAYLERAFHVDLGENIYNIYKEIKLRKINLTKFLDSMKENLIKRIETQNDR